MWVSICEKEGCKLLVGAETEERVKKITASLEDYTGFVPDKPCKPRGLKEVKGLEVSQQYINSVKNPDKNMNYHLKKGFSKIDDNSFIDWWTFTDDATLEQLKQSFLQKISEESLEDLDEKQSIEYFLEKNFPEIGRHGLKNVLGEDLWEIKLEDLQTLSEQSRKAVKNGEKGKRFEKFFKEICNSNGLTCYRSSSQVLRHFLPEVRKDIRAEFGSLKGIPDFFVDKGNSTTLNNFLECEKDFWEPENRFAFVEVKYGSSKLSKRQRKMVSFLNKLGVEVKLFKGDFKDYSLEKV